MTRDDVLTDAVHEIRHLCAGNGLPIRAVSRVRFADGRTITFMERMSGRRAFEQAYQIRVREMRDGVDTEATDGAS